MKKRLTLALATFALFASGTTLAQFQLPGLSLPNLFPAAALPDLPFTPGSAVTTALPDSFPLASWMELLQENAEPTPATTFNLAPGYDRFQLQSYCLHAGSYGPSDGAGYPLAPLKGDRAELIRSILQRSASFPNIAQHDIQRLIWGIEAGTRYTDYPLDFQLKMSALVTPADIALTFVSLPTLGAALPGPLRDALAYYDSLRSTLTQASTDFASLERLAVLAGAAPLGPGSRSIPAGVWTAAGSGFYARAIPSDYSQTVLEVVRTAPFRLERDARGRITRFSSGPYTVDTTYDDAPGSDQLTEGGVSVPVWRFATLRLSGPGGVSVEVQHRGFVIASSALRYGSPPMSGQLALPTQLAQKTQQPRFVRYQPGASLATWRERFERGKALYDRVDEYRGLYGRATQRPSEQAINDFTDLNHYRDGVMAAVQGEGLGWLTEHFQRQRLALEYATCVVAGDCTAPGAAPGTADDAALFDPTQFVATPANTSMQRLGLSARLF